MVYQFYLRYYFQYTVKENAAMGTAMGTVGFMLSSSMDVPKCPPEH